MKNLILRHFVLAVVCIMAVVNVASAETSFYDGFSSGTLDPAWQVVEYNGSLPRAEGQTSPANHYQLVDGKLRYVVDPMTYSFGFVNDYQRTSPYYDYDPGLELQRSFDGDQWVFESKSSYHIPFSNHRQFTTSVVFGDGQTGLTTYVQFSRTRDVSTGANRYQLAMLGFDSTHTYAQGNFTGFMQVDDVVLTSDDTRYFRLDRSGGVLTAMWGADGVAWQTVGSYDFGNQFDGLQQRVILSGSCWFNTVGSYADHDYVSVVPEPATLLLLSLGGLVLRRGRK